MKKILGLPLKILLPLLAISLFSVGSFATTVGVTPATYQAQNGVIYNIAGGFTAASNGFQVVQATTAASTQPCTWSSGGTCTTALTSGDWYYSLTITINAAATASHTYTATVTWNTGSGYTTMGTLTVTSPATITAGQTMTFNIDCGTTSFNAPAAVSITVA